MSKIRPKVRFSVGTNVAGFNLKSAFLCVFGPHNVDLCNFQHPVSMLHSQLKLPRNHWDSPAMPKLVQFLITSDAVFFGSKTSFKTHAGQQRMMPSIGEMTGRILKFVSINTVGVNETQKPVAKMENVYLATMMRFLCSKTSLKTCAG